MGGGAWPFLVGGVICQETLVEARSDSDVQIDRQT